MNGKMKHFIDPTIDFVFKVLFASKGNEYIVSHFLNSVLQPKNKITSVSIKNPFNEREFDKDKLSVVDIKVEDDSNYHREYQLIDEKTNKKLSDQCAIQLLELKKWQLPQCINGTLGDEDIWPFFFTHAHNWLVLPEIAKVQVMEQVMSVLQQISDESAQYERYIARRRSQITTQENLQQLKSEKALRVKAEKRADELAIQAEQIAKKNEELLKKIEMLEAKK